MKFNEKKILHLTPTPLVQAPEKVSNILNRFSEYSSEIVVLNDYPNHLKGKFIANAILYSVDTKDVVQKLIERANIIHVHNFLPTTFIDFFKQCLVNSDAKLVYQVHSPLREGPIFYDYAQESGFDFDKCLVVSQYHPRLYPSFIPVPNIITAKPSLNLLNKNEKPFILFSPAHKNVGLRWNDKITKNLNKVLDSVNGLGLAKVKEVSGLSPHDVFSIRRFSHISIDELATGAFHQVSMEGLATGNVVFNNADYFSCQMLSFVAKTSKNVPFVRTDDDAFSENLMAYLSDNEKIRFKQEEGYQYFVDNLLPEHLVKHFIKIYDEVCDVI